MEFEPFLGTPEMKKFQLEGIKETLKQQYEASAFWKERLDEAKVKPEDIKTWDDFRKRVPVSEVKDLFSRLVVMAEGDVPKAISLLIGRPYSDIVLMSSTSGTTGMPTPYPFTPEGLDLVMEWYARAGWRAGMRPGDRVLVAFGLSMFIAGVPMCYAVTKVGAMAIPAGAEAGSERILQYAKLFKANCLACTPSLAEHLIERAPEVIGDDVGSLGLKLVLCGGEPGAGVPEIKERIEEAYGCKLFDAGAGMGGSCDYPEYQGMHWLMDDYAYCEVVDPETKEPLPFEDGVKGEGVMTTFGPAGFGGIRTSLNDIWEVFSSPCPCGKSGVRYKVGARLDDMMKVKGVMVYPSLIDGVISKFVPRTTGEFRIVLDAPLPRVEPPLNLKVEYGEGINESELEGLGKEIAERMHSKLKITPQIQWIPPRSLERAAMKKRFFEKRYEKS